MLVLPMKASVLKKGTELPWLSNVGAGWILDADNTLELPSGDDIPTCLVHLTAEVTETAVVEHNYFWFSTENSVDYPPAVINPSKTADVGVQVTKNIVYGDQLQLPAERDVAEAGTALHAILAMQLLQGQASRAQLQSVSDELLNDSGLESLNAEAVLAKGDTFKNWLGEQWPGAKLHIEYPIRMVNELGQRLNGSIDLLIETDHGWVVVDHKSTSTGEDQLPYVASQYGGQLAAYRQALEAVTDKPVLGQWIHFMAMGTMLECELSSF
jgi:uncharacterized protein YjiS (DUF1127 family)